jgi:hypothetical protein
VEDEEENGRHEKTHHEGEVAPFRVVVGEPAEDPTRPIVGELATGCQGVALSQKGMEATIPPSIETQPFQVPWALSKNSISWNCPLRIQ